MGFSIENHPAITPEVDDAQFAAVKKIIRAEVLAAFQRLRLRGRDSAAKNNAINVGVNQFQFAGDKDLFNKKMTTEGFGVVTLHIFRVMCVTSG